ncbi:unnamed protein product [Adineta steineri]|uniref:F-box domain-containing protein n=1 Tax=Adineta steineri TaxID=433720 RepID=A0A814QQC2_9BILA|nr:unnamed protein product [Adineta steineri]CAF1123436.1 unnamed protein product [Adineta steineri]
MTLFESLPNELLLNCFEYFDACHLLAAFCLLNSRFDKLLYKYFRAYHLDLRRISKQDFNILCKQHLFLIIDRIISLHLADYNETPGLLHRFFFHGFLIDQFIHLKKLALYRIDYINVIKLLGDRHRLLRLCHISISECNMSIIPRDASYSINQIWNLPKLTYLGLERCHLLEIDFSRLLGMSSTIEHLSIQAGMGCSFNNIIQILQHTPSMRILSITVESEDENEQLPIMFTPITTLKLQFYGTTRALNSFLQNMSNLHNLTIDMIDNYMNGHEWKQIIVEHLTKLKTLRFRMPIYGLNSHGIEKEIDELLDTFRTPFWLDEHQWYVRCDWYSDFTSSSGCLYTLPYTFDLFTGTAYKQSKWTCPEDTMYWIFDRVQKLTFRTSIKQPFDIHSIYLPNIHDIKTNLPLPDKLWSVIPTFNHLTSLSVSLSEGDTSFNLQTLLDQAPHLYTLMIEDENLSALRVVSRLTSVSIRQLVFIPCLLPDTHFFDDADCAAFARSSLARQCEVLEIHIRSRASVMNLIRTMINLRAMTIYVKDDDDMQSSPVKHLRRNFLTRKTNSMRDGLNSLWRKLSIQKRKLGTMKNTTENDARSSYNTEPELIEWLQNNAQRRCWISCSSGWTGDFYVKCWID